MGVHFLCLCRDDLNKKLGNLEKRASLLSTLLGITKADGQSYFHIDYLVDKVMKLTPEEKEENKAYWIKSAEGGGAAEGGGEGGGLTETGGEVPTEAVSAQGGAQTGGAQAPAAQAGEAQTGGGAQAPEAEGEFEF